MNALIFAAGLGTRLGSISKNKPKALVKMAGKPMLLHAIEKLSAAGATNIVVNVHHHAEMIKDYIATLHFTGVDICISDESEELLETGGGLLFAKNLFIPNKAIILYNADIITSANLAEMIAYHKQKKGIATLMVKDRETSRYFLFNKDMKLSGWKNINTNEFIYTRKAESYESLAFSGVHIVDYSILNLLGDVRKFSITNGYLDLSKEHSIFAWKCLNNYWFDIGTPEKWEKANDFMKKQ
ncbi:nucleotidyltransferase family protein [Saccharicrinis aurantiacus]|uniref:nucleotidyltransferase family protein n=1 Tax=Saccharicrinis aurantiacus TaxID=1849719 RepID=UPI002490FA97|nr:sugar phosphate nucleotidyltransferase [Saccharicrinis aurantiacus]